MSSTINQNIFVLTKIRNGLVTLTLNDIKTTVDDAILLKLQDKYEGKCSKNGYIKRGSIKIIKRTAGEYMKEHFSNTIHFRVIFSCLICNPAKDSIIKCKIHASNTMGLKCFLYDNTEQFLQIIAPRALAGVNHEINIEHLKVGDIVNLKIINTQLHFQKFVAVFGIIVSDDDDKTTLDTNDNDSDNSSDNELNEEDIIPNEEYDDKSTYSNSDDEAPYVENHNDDDNDDIENNNDGNNDNNNDSDLSINEDSDDDVDANDDSVNDNLSDEDLDKLNIDDDESI